MVAIRYIDLSGDASTLYQVAGGAAIGFLAFVVTPVATLLTFTGGVRSRALDRRHRKTIIQAMAWAFLMSLASLGLSLVGAAADTGAEPAEVLRCLTLGGAAASGLAVGRLFWFFVASLRVRDADEEHPITLTQR